MILVSVATFDRLAMRGLDGKDVEECVFQGVKEGEESGGMRERVHGRDVFLGERVARISDEQASLTDCTVTNDDQLHTLLYSHTKWAREGQWGEERGGERQRGRKYTDTRQSQGQCVLA